MQKKFKLVIIILISILVLIIAVGVGSVYIPPLDTIKIILSRIFSNKQIQDYTETIILQIRIPRALLAFVCGAGLGVSGVITQAVLQNPLASSYTLGVSSGASVGACLALFFNISIFGAFAIQIAGFLASFLTVFLSIFLAYKLDKAMQNNTIILIGFAFSLFANAILSIMLNLKQEELKTIVYWQMGSFAMKDTVYLKSLAIIILICLFIAIIYFKEMNILAFGDKEAMLLGVMVKRVKWILLSISALLTGAIISVAGVIGFVDLFIPHIARRLFGADNRYVLISSVFLAGAFMVLADLIARTIISPLELPVGAITSFIGAPFFIYLYFSKRK